METEFGPHQIAALVIISVSVALLVAIEMGKKFLAYYPRWARRLRARLHRSDREAKRQREHYNPSDWETHF
jgi:hypothetical protein